MTILYSTDDHYAMLAGVSAASLIKNNRGSSSIEIIILDNHIGDTNKQRLKSTVESLGSSIRFVSAHDCLARIQSLKAPRYSSFSVYARLFVSELLPELNGRVLYLDCDTIVRGSLAGLLQHDLQGKAVGMACDCVRNEYKRVIDFPEDRCYYNSGVMLLDLDVWRKVQCGRRILDHMENVRAVYPLVDQDLLNIVCSNDIVRIDSTYNCLSQFFLHDYPSALKVYGLDPAFWLRQVEFDRARANPVLCHFSGNTFVRPWYANSFHPFKNEFLENKALTAWATAPLKTFSIPKPYRIQGLGYKYLPGWLFAILHQHMQRTFIRKTYKL